MTGFNFSSEKTGRSFSLHKHFVWFAGLVCIFLSMVVTSCKDNSVNSESRQWIKVRDRIDKSAYRSIFFIDYRNGWIAGDSGKVIYTSDGGQNWQSRNTAKNISLWDICFTDNKTGWAVGGSYLFSTLDGGNSWKSQRISADTLETFMDVVFKSADKGWINSNKGALYYTSDKGVSWTVQRTWDHVGASVAFTDADNGFILPLANQRLIVTKDGGKSWTEKPCAIPFASEIYFLSEQKGFVITNYLLSSRYTDKSPVYMTNDAGGSWSICDSLDFGWAMNILFSGSNNGWIIGDNKIYYSQDGGLKWDLQFEDNSGGSFFTDISSDNSGTIWVVDIYGALYKYKL